MKIVQIISCHPHEKRVRIFCAFVLIEGTCRGRVTLFIRLAIEFTSRDVIALRNQAQRFVYFE